jgi:hypothetical protein
MPRHQTKRKHSAPAARRQLTEQELAIIARTQMRFISVCDDRVPEVAARLRQLLRESQVERPKVYSK